MKYIVRERHVYKDDVVEFEDGCIGISIDENGVLSWLEPFTETEED